MMRQVFEDSMPPCVPERCRKCPIRNWAEFFRTLNRDGGIIADSIHEVLGSECVGAGEKDIGTDRVRMLTSTCQQESVQDGSIKSVIEAHCTEAEIIMSGQIIALIAQQALDESDT